MNRTVVVLVSTQLTIHWEVTESVRAKNEGNSPEKEFIAGESFTEDLLSCARLKEWGEQPST